MTETTQWFITLAGLILPTMFYSLRNKEGRLKFWLISTACMYLLPVIFSAISIKDWSHEPDKIIIFYHMTILALILVWLFYKKPKNN